MELIRAFVLFSILLFLLSGIFVSTIATAQSDSDDELKQDIDDIWYRSEAFTLADNESPAGNNESFTVTIHSVEFEFLYFLVEPNVLDIPTIVVVRVRFEDGSTEILEPTVGGYVGFEYRLTLTDHSEPKAAIVSAYNYTHEAWYGWYYAVSPDLTTTGEITSSSTSTPEGNDQNLGFIQIGMYATVTLVWIIVITFIIIDYKKVKS